MQFMQKCNFSGTYWEHETEYMVQLSNINKSLNLHSVLEFKLEEKTSKEASTPQGLNEYVFYTLLWWRVMTYTWLQHFVLSTEIQNAYRAATIYRLYLFHTEFPPGAMPQEIYEQKNQTK